MGWGVSFILNGVRIYNFCSNANDAIIDAVMNYGEDLDEMLDLCYSHHNSHLKEYYLDDIQKYNEHQK